MSQDLYEKDISRLALFPLQNPNPVIEVDWKAGMVTYMNPAAENYFPDMRNSQFDHPLFKRIKEVLAETASEFQCEVTVDDRIFEQKVYFLPGTELIRVYSHDITRQKEIQKDLARLALFPKQNPNPVMEADWQNGIVTYLNPAAELSFPELTAQHLDHPIFSVIKERLGSTTSDFQCEVIVKERIYEQKIYFLPGTGLIRVYSHDITQQKEIQKNLARLASFPEQNPSPIIEIDLDGNITYRNPACFRIFPDLTATDHPVLGPFREKFADLKAGTISSYSVEIRHNDRFYTQQAKIFGEYQVIRIFNLDITQQKHNEELIREKNKEITDSINYAKRIQDAKLPKIEDVKAAFHDSFILFKPKDIVSGDFYFFERKDDKLFIAAADCTGHGVPGAFMSLIGCEKLEDALTQTSEPSQVLRLLNTGVRASLRQSQSCDSTRDGMDIAFCAVDVNARTIEFAGANRPLWILNKDTRELREIRGTKTAIGGFTDNTQHFHTNTVQLSKGDTFYIFSDGYADTFGGTDEKKLTTKKFKEILLGICHLSMDEQKTYLDQFIETWKNGIEQIDDILVIGIRL